MLLQRWKAWREQQLLKRYAIDELLWTGTVLRYPFLRHLAPSDHQQLRKLSSLFLASKEFHGAQGFVVTDEMAVAVAAQACLPVLHLGLSGYDGFVGIVMHAADVTVHREFQDEAGVVHHYLDELAGEAMEGGPMMLTWQALLDAEQDQESPYNVVIHEFAHVLDMREGLSQRLPDFSTAYEIFCQQVEAGADTLIDPYGSESLEEFFAVCCETFFVAGEAMYQAHPRLYESLGGYFRQDPAQRSRTGSGNSKHEG
ncbi:MAG: zinc-dependent peptidase [Rhizobacter sp.]